MPIPLTTMMAAEAKNSKKTIDMQSDLCAARTGS